MARTNVKPLPPGISGVRAEEIGESRLGVQSGTFGVYNATRTWRVYTATKQDNPIATLRGLSSNLGGAQEGDNYPWAEMSSMVLLYFVLLDHWLGTNVWIVQGVYGPPLLIQSQSNVWDFRLQGGLETETVLTELSSNGVPGRMIGPPVYSPLPNDISTAFPFVTGNTERGSTNFLLPPDAYIGGVGYPFLHTLPRYGEGATRRRRSGTLTITKIVPAWYQAAVRAAMDNLCNINSDDFYVRTLAGDILWAEAPSVEGEGVMMFTDISVESVQSPVTVDLVPVPPGTPTGGGSFRVTLTFQFNPDGWRHHRTHTYKDDAGIESPLITSSGFVDNNGTAIPSGSRLDEAFTLYRSTSLSAIVGGFG